MNSEGERHVDANSCSGSRADDSPVARGDASNDRSRSGQAYVTVIMRLLSKLRGVLKPHLFLPLFDQVLVSGSAFLTTVLLARNLSLDQFGVYSLAWMVVLFVGGIQAALILFPMMSLGPQKSGRERDAFFSGLTAQQVAFAFVCAAVMVVGTSTLAQVFAGPLSLSFALSLGVAGGVCQMQEFQRRLLFTEGRPFAALISDCVRYGGQVAGLAAAFALGFYGVDAILWITAATALAAVLVFPGFLLGGLRLGPKYLLREFQSNWHFSSWLVGSSLLAWLSSQSSGMLTGVILGPAAVGALRAGSLLIGIAGVFMQALQNVIPLQAARSFARDGMDGLGSYLVRMGLFVTSGVGLLCLVFAVAPEFWLEVLYGPKFVGYGYILVWNAALYYMTSFEFPFSVGLRTIERTRPTFVAYVAGAVLMLGSIYPLATMLELNGVMIATAGTLVVQNLIMLNGLRTAMRDRKSAPGK
jgi:O-antigen/teichoic acid export membrane protein